MSDNPQTPAHPSHQIIDGAEPFFFPGGPAGCLLIHGYTGTPKEMRWLGEYLSELGHTVLGIRLFAHATTPEDMKRARWADWLADVEDGFHILNSCCQKVFVIGLSMGGILSLLFASRRPLAGVVAMSTPHHLPNDPRIRFIKPLSLIQPYLPKGPPAWFDQKAFQEHISYPSDPTRAYAEVRDMLVEMRKGLENIHAPVLLINSKDDPVVTPEERHLELIFEGLGSQEKQSLWIEQSGHVIPRDAQREQVFQAVGNFVNRLAAPIP
jgi:carboxylesterase